MSDTDDDAADGAWPARDREPAAPATWRRSPEGARNGQSRSRFADLLTPLVPSSRQPRQPANGSSHPQTDHGDPPVPRARANGAEPEWPSHPAGQQQSPWAPEWAGPADTGQLPPVDDGALPAPPVRFRPRPEPPPPVGPRLVGSAAANGVAPRPVSGAGDPPTDGWATGERGFPPIGAVAAGASTESVPPGTPTEADPYPNGHRQDAAVPEWPWSPAPPAEPSAGRISVPAARPTSPAPGPVPPPPAGLPSRRAQSPNNTIPGYARGGEATVNGHDVAGPGVVGADDGGQAGFTPPPIGQPGYGAGPGDAGPGRAGYGAGPGASESGAGPGRAGYGADDSGDRRPDAAGLTAGRLSRGFPRGDELAPPAPSARLTRAFPGDDDTPSSRPSTPDDEAAGDRGFSGFTPVGGGAVRVPVARGPVGEGSVPEPAGETAPPDDSRRGFAARPRLVSVDGEPHRGFAGGRSVDSADEARGAFADQHGNAPEPLRGLAGGHGTDPADDEPHRGLADGRGGDPTDGPLRGLAGGRAETRGFAGQRDGVPVDGDARRGFAGRRGGESVDGGARGGFAGGRGGDPTDGGAPSGFPGQRDGVPVDGDARRGVAGGRGAHPADGGAPRGFADAPADDEQRQGFAGQRDEAVAAEDMAGRGFAGGRGVPADDEPRRDFAGVAGDGEGRGSARRDEVPGNDPARSGSGGQRGGAPADDPVRRGLVAQRSGVATDDDPVRRGLVAQRGGAAADDMAGRGFAGRDGSSAADGARRGFSGQRGGVPVDDEVRPGFAGPRGGQAAEEMAGRGFAGRDEVPADEGVRRGFDGQRGGMPADDSVRRGSGVQRGGAAGEVAGRGFAGGRGGDPDDDGARRGFVGQRGDVPDDDGVRRGFAGQRGDVPDDEGVRRGFAGQRGDGQGPRGFAGQVPGDDAARRGFAGPSGETPLSGERPVGPAGAAGPGRGRLRGPAADASGRSVVDDMIDELELPQRVPAEPDVPAVPEPLSDVPADPPQLARIATHLRRDDLPQVRERPDGFDVEAILAAVRGVTGVKGASLRQTPAGAHSLRLDLADGADAAEVSRHVARLLQERMGLAAAPQNLPAPDAPDDPLGGATPPTGFARTAGLAAGPAKDRPANLPEPARPPGFAPTSVPNGAPTATPPQERGAAADAEPGPAHRGRAHVDQGGLDTRDLSGHTTGPTQGGPHQVGPTQGARQVGSPQGAHQVGSPQGVHQAGPTQGAHQVGSGQGGPQQSVPAKGGGASAPGGTARDGRVEDGSTTSSLAGPDASGRNAPPRGAQLYGARADSGQTGRRDQESGGRPHDTPRRGGDVGAQRASESGDGDRAGGAGFPVGRNDSGARRARGVGEAGGLAESDHTGGGPIRGIRGGAGTRSGASGAEAADATNLGAQSGRTPGRGGQTSDADVEHGRGTVGRPGRQLPPDQPGAGPDQPVGHDAGQQAGYGSPRLGGDGYDAAGQAGQRSAHAPSRHAPGRPGGYGPDQQGGPGAERATSYAPGYTRGQERGGVPAPGSFPALGGAAGVIGSVGGHPVTAAYSGGQISGTESAPSRPLNPGSPPGPRVVIDHVQVSTFGLDATVETRLAAGKQLANGLATGPAVDAYVLRLCAISAASAIDELLRTSTRVEEGVGRCFVEHAAVVPFGNCEVAVVVVLLVCGGWVEQLAGSALVSGDPRQAVVRATLAAVNRRLEALLSD